ncbi:two-component system response regulator [Chryseomicrobium excrementi]|uniref:Transcriptional regulatory protein n=1 Tax=Chryseomicrobium excrementi TaxID=2041346 RepID=A0A2M9F0Y1_9BACL|nr:response regulator [Chryseomicrobium excrementi]PJK17110.1 two-component system response regulator [Chryseomicrobium excrementi]
MTRPIEVLIVEDDPRIARIHEKFVASVEGFLVVGIAHTVVEAKMWMDELQPQLVLVDVYLPDDLGTQFVDYVKQMYPYTDVILITAATEVDVVRKAYASGIEDYLLKPVTMQTFTESLTAYKEKKQLLTSSTEFTESQIRQLFKKTAHPEIEAAPKGIDRLTREKVSGVLSNYPDGITAERLGTELGMSRSTARRYLEHLVTENTLLVEQVYGSVGRPERRYFLK